MKGIIAIACLVLVACAAVEARPKRSVLLASPVVAAVPVVSSSVVHHNPTTVVKTEQVQGVGHSSYQYSTEVRNSPVVHTTHSVAAAAPVVSAPVVSAPVVSTVHHAVPSYAYSAYSYPYAAYSYNYNYPYAAYSPYHYVVGK